jgi:VanZ family protein
MPSASESPTPRPLTRFLPPLLWMAVIALGSSSLFSGERTGSWLFTLLGHLSLAATPGMVSSTNIGLRKLGHLVEFGILAVLWYRALTPAPRATALALALTAGYGGFDELRQALVPSRDATLVDVAVDSLGGIVGLAAWTEAGPLRAATLRGAAWGTGLLCGLAGLGVAVDSALGRPVAVIGAAAIGLAVMTVGLTRLARDARVHAPRGPGDGAPP